MMGKTGSRKRRDQPHTYRFLASIRPNNVPLLVRELLEKNTNLENIHADDPMVGNGNALNLVDTRRIYLNIKDFELAIPSTEIEKALKLFPYIEELNVILQPDDDEHEIIESWPNIFFDFYEAED